MAVQKTILVIEDQKAELDRLSELLQPRYRVIGAQAGNEALRVFREENTDLVLLDIVLGDMDGLNVLRILRKLDEQVPIIMMSGITKINTVVECMKLGAKDYITKPFNPDEILHAVDRAMGETQREKDLVSLQERLESEHRFEDIVGQTPKMKAVFNQIERLKGNQTSVLITGESGTGKEMVARAIHKTTARAGAPYLAINCGAIPSELFESELFGHEPGAFTGAVARRIGKVELAQDGTLFLDEIGTMPLGLQVKLLRVLEERTITRVGGSKQIPVSFRLISATNADLEVETRMGRFREDLYYRINVIHIPLPPLRERRDDIPHLAEYFLKKHTHTGARGKTFSQESMERLLAYEWKGNVRELENVIERALILSPGQEIQPSDLPLGPVANPAAPEPAPPGAAQAKASPPPANGHPRIGDGFALHEYLESLERKYLEEALIATGWHKEKAAKLLGIHRNTLTRRLLHFKLGK
ncbi:MAG: sigma-54 dependent transcriptional regulator [Bdellovibrionota bacterium]